MIITFWYCKLAFLDFLIRCHRPPVEDDFLGTEGLGVIYAGKVGDYQEDGVGGILMDADVAAEARFSSLFSCRKGRPWIW